MLKKITIENYALIDKTCIDFSKGFSVITGETGAGKSIILGALGLLLGQRADVKVLRDTEKKCIVEAVFDVANYDLKNLFEQEGLDYDEECIIRREILPNGKSRSFVNDTPATVSSLKIIGDKLIDIHSQHKNLLLSDNSFQLLTLDSFSKNGLCLSEYKNLFAQYEANIHKLNKIKSELEKRNADKDYIEFQFNQLSEANLHENEQEELENECATLTHSSEIKEALSKIIYYFEENDFPINKSVKDSINLMREISKFVPEISDLASRLDSCLIELKDISREVDMKLSDVEIDPSRLDFVNERLDFIYGLEKKHNANSVTQLIEIRNSFGNKLKSLETGCDEVVELEKEIDSQKNVLLKKAEILSQNRENVKDIFKNQIEDLLHQMGMQNAKFDVSFEKLKELNSTGFDQVEFLFSANKDQRQHPITEVASGGEMARVMLSLKYILSQSINLPTIILDEIDTGVSGEIAGRMGNIMLQMGEKMQVLSITHLPQIASKGNAHYKVYKEDTADSTISHIVKLKDDERLLEIAKMLSGDKITEAAINNAKELLNS